MEVIPAVNSDHCPLVLVAKPKMGDGGQFKYETFWEDHEECAEVIRRGWKKGYADGGGWQKVLNRIRMCKVNFPCGIKRPLRTQQKRLED